MLPRTVFSNHLHISTNSKCPLNILTHAFFPLEIEVSVTEGLKDLTVIEKETAVFTVTTNYDCIPHVWYKGKLKDLPFQEGPFYACFTTRTNVIYLFRFSDDVKLVKSHDIEMTDEGTLHTLKLSACTLEESSEIKFISKSAESTARLTVIGKLTCIQVIFSLS